MVQPHRPAVMPTHELIGIIMRIVRARDAGLDVNDSEAITKLAKEVERDLVPRINPDMAYSIAELERWGLRHGFFYGRHRHLIRKDGRKTFVWGREVLAEIEAMPKLAPDPVRGGKIAATTRRRGRPRKDAIKMESGVWDQAHSSADSVTLVLPPDEVEPGSRSGLVMCLRIPAPPCSSRLYDAVRTQIQYKGSG